MTHASISQKSVYYDAFAADVLATDAIIQAFDGPNNESERNVDNMLWSMQHASNSRCITVLMKSVAKPARMYARSSSLPKK